jgi:hypothetical protein
MSQTKGMTKANHDETSLFIIYEWRPTEFLLCESSWLLKILRQENAKIAFYGILCTPRWQKDKLSIMIYLCNEQHAVK